MKKGTFCKTIVNVEEGITWLQFSDTPHLGVEPAGGIEEPFVFQKGTHGITLYNSHSGSIVIQMTFYGFV